MPPMRMFDRLITQQTTLAVVGLGYVGLPLALAFAKHYRVLGFDIDEQRIAQLRQGSDPSKEMGREDFEGRHIRFTSRAEDLAEAAFYVVAVPTPVDKYHTPDLSYLEAASAFVGRAIASGDVVVFESTVYPGCTEEDCIPIVERVSGLRAGADFGYGYSPERTNPGDKLHRVDNVLKIVSGCDAATAEDIARIYGHMVKAGVHVAPSIKVAEAAKVVENAQRDLNISFVNELAIIFDRMGIDTQAVLAAAGTKWNFMRFTPGLVGGHCIGVDPYYLLHKSKQLGYDPQVILSGRRVNDAMPAFVAKKMVQLLIKSAKNPRDCKLLVLGITFKENVTDIRNSKVVDLVHELRAYSIEVHIHDPLASAAEVQALYGLQLSDLDRAVAYDGLIIAVAHDAYKNLSPADIKQWLAPRAVLMDLKRLHAAADFGEQVYWGL